MAYGLWLHRMTGSAAEANRFGREYGVVRSPARTGGPAVEPSDGAGPVPFFSLSYAGDLVLAAFAAVPVGVDAEQVPSPATAAAPAVWAGQAGPSAALPGP
ncbi:DUF6417 family protein [Streptomyces olivochromogenes]|uniref:DUF6417 family protein n=1 Tax=Streptomyces olivochromogenes TaxID=1963 RepID=UPI0036DE8232